ncbi:NAD(P)/FAD-dependent oxidoreductase [Leptolyngbya sp. 7M]|uniref:NAD(P)/FAD-dependent oxidoreductase n=1 Tax=Leptolyngbya sp. 7M TaxID=2812896 RepID=UPI001B8D60B0|nr:FAD-dependent oxidoreductase [Leptolyngbya sp. 7M]QYO66672.1 NAD(P)/FAD-dependent oxidoreductase [Leptolyngbya sp. 7M]
MGKTQKIIVVGGGVAGLSAAIWLRDLGLECIVVERASETGGQLHRIYNDITNYPGIKGISGAEFAKILHEQASSFGVSFEKDEVRSISIERSQVDLRSGNVVEYDALVIATGVRRRKLGVEGEIEFEGKGILESGAKDPAAVVGKTVVIVGGGDAAVENAAILAGFAQKVVIIHRGSELRARSPIIKTALNCENVEVRINTTVTRFVGDESLRGVLIRDVEDGSEALIGAQNALIRIGVAPNTEPFSEFVKLDMDGYVEVDRECKTSTEGIYAVGDVAFKVSPTIATAVGTGSTAAKSIHAWIQSKKSL